MKPARFGYVRAETADHAVEVLGGADAAARILAGGQSLIPALSARTINASLLLDIMRCPGLDEVSQTPGEITIGAACRQSRIEKSSVVLQAIPLLPEALGWVAMPQVRSRGTVVGCLAQANAGGEVPVVSLALDAELNVLSRGGVRQRIPAREVYAVEAGTRLPSRSLIESASFRTLAAGEGWGFCEVQLRPGHFALVCCAATLELEESGRIRSARIALGGLTASPYRADRAEKSLAGGKRRRRFTGSRRRANCFGGAALARAHRSARHWRLPSEGGRHGGRPSAYRGARALLEANWSDP